MSLESDLLLSTLLLVPCRFRLLLLVELLAPLDYLIHGSCVLGLLRLEPDAVAQLLEDKSTRLGARLRMQGERRALELVAEVPREVDLGLGAKEGPFAVRIADEY